MRKALLSYSELTDGLMSSVEAMRNASYLLRKKRDKDFNRIRRLRNKIRVIGMNIKVVLNLPES